MAILATIVGLLGRFTGKVLTMSLGWASTLLFGRVPHDREIYLTAITFGAVIWAVLVVGVLVPDVGAILLAFAPIPEWVDEDLVRVGMLVAALVLPALLGAAASQLLKPEDRPHGPKEVAVQVARGYPLAAGLSLMLVFLAVIGITRKVSALLRRRTDAHIPIVLKPGGYEGLVDDLDDAISAAGVDVVEGEAPRVLVVPGHVLASVARPSVRALLPERLVQLVHPDVEILVYPSDVAITGTRTAVARVQSAVASRLTTAEAWLTRSAEAQRIEDQLEQLAASAPSSEVRAAVLADIDRRLASKEIPYDEWEILFRERLQVERDLLTGRTPGESPAEPAPHPVHRSDHRFDPVGLVAAAIASGLVLLNIALVLADWRRQEERQS